MGRRTENNGLEKWLHVKRRSIGAPFPCVRRIEMLVQIYVNSSFMGLLLCLVEAGRYQISAGDFILSVV